MRNLVEKFEKNEDVLQMPIPGINMNRLNSSNTPRFIPQLSSNTSIQPRRNYGLTNFNTRDSLNFGAMAFADSKIGNPDINLGKLSSTMNNSVVQALQGDNPFDSERNVSFFSNNNDPLGMLKRKSTLRN